MNDHGELNKLQTNGHEVRKIMADIMKDEESGGSVLMEAARNTYSKLRSAPSEQDTKLPMWRRTLMHWAIAMSAAYKMRATDADRAAFAKHSRMYVMEKSCICAGITSWYDWQMYSIFPKVFYTYGSLYAICQEGMEACQKQSNMFLRLGNKFANAGRIPLNVIRAGRDAVVAFLKKRKENLTTPAQFLFKKQLLAFFAEFYEAFKLAEELKKAGTTVDWKTKYVPAWRSFVCISIIYRIIARGAGRGDQGVLRTGGARAQRPRAVG